MQNAEGMFGPTCVAGVRPWLTRIPFLQSPHHRIASLADRCDELITWSVTEHHIYPLKMLDPLNERTYITRLRFRGEACSATGHQGSRRAESSSSLPIAFRASCAGILLSAASRSAMPQPRVTLSARSAHIGAATKPFARSFGSSPLAASHCRPRASQSQAQTDHRQVTSALNPSILELAFRIKS